MGAANVLPTIPSFVAGAPSIDDLNNLSYAASFLIDHSVRPTWKFVNRGTSLSMTSATWTAMTWDTNIFDSDAVAPAGTTWTTAVIQTQGYYHVGACVQPQNLASRVNFVCAFKWTAGANSPYGSQSPAFFAWRANNMSVTGTATATQAGCIASLTPVPMYPLDTLQVMAYVSGGTPVLEANDNAGQPTLYMNGRFSMQFTGRWARTGS